MSLYDTYLAEIETRKEQGLNPKPIDDGPLAKEVIGHIQNGESPHRADCLKFFIYNTLPGTTSAAGEKAQFLKAIILGEAKVAEITPAFAFELLGHMKGGPSVEVLLDLAFGEDEQIARDAAEVLKTQVFLYDADTDRIRDAYKAGNPSRRISWTAMRRRNSLPSFPISTKRSKSSHISPQRAISPPTFSALATRPIPVPIASCMANA